MSRTSSSCFPRMPIAFGGCGSTARRFRGRVRLGMERTRGSNRQTPGLRCRRYSEYVIVDAREGETGVEFYRLGQDGQYHAVELDARGRFHSLSCRAFGSTQPGSGKIRCRAQKAFCSRSLRRRTKPGFCLKSGRDDKATRDLEGSLRCPFRLTARYAVSAATVSTRSAMSNGLAAKRIGPPSGKGWRPGRS